MSQAKVDKYKKEKKNREKVIKRKKIRNFILVMILVFFVSMGIGYPLGQFLYKKNYEKRMENATVSAASYDYWVQQYIDTNYGHLFSDNVYNSDDTASDTDSTSTPTDAITY